MKNQTIITDGNVNIAREVINCNITARKSIRIYGHTLSVAGGTLTSTEAIVVKTVGNISGVKTLLQIACEPEIVAQAAKIKEEIEGHKANIKKLTALLDTLPPAKKLNKEYVRKLKTAIVTLGQQLATLENRARTISIAMSKFDNMFIRIDRVAYPGTTFKIGEWNTTLSDTITGGKTVRIIDGEMRIL